MLPARNNAILYPVSEYPTLPLTAQTTDMVPWSAVLNGAVLLAAGCLLSRTTTAAPSRLRFDNSTIWHGSLEVRDTAHGSSFSSPGVDLRVEPRAADSFTFRILPPGASITWGYKSNDGTGY
jgi:hypothetical protein